MIDNMRSEAIFIENAEKYKGEMKSGHCPECGSIIHLHEKMENGYCEFCGEKISFASIRNVNFSQQVIDSMTGEELYNAANKGTHYDERLTLAAAEKDYIPALRKISYSFLADSRAGEMRDFAERGAQLGDIDCKAYLVAAKVLLSEYECNKDALNEANGAYCSQLSEPAKAVLDVIISTVNEQIEEEERERKRREQQKRDENSFHQGNVNWYVRSQKEHEDYLKRLHDWSNDWDADGSALMHF